MHITLYMAPSIDGYIAKSDKDSEWVDEACVDSFMQTIREYGCIIMGNTTYSMYTPDLYPIKDVLNIVITSNHPSKPNTSNLVFVKDAQEALEMAQSMGHKMALLIGGGTTNSSFLKDNYIDNIILDIHPIILGNGIKIFENIEKQVELERISINPMENGLVQIRYKVIK